MSRRRKTIRFLLNPKCRPCPDEGCGYQPVLSPVTKILYSNEAEITNLHSVTIRCLNKHEYKRK